MPGHPLYIFQVFQEVVSMTWGGGVPDVAQPWTPGPRRPGSHYSAHLKQKTCVALNPSRIFIVFETLSFFSLQTIANHDRFVATLINIISKMGYFLAMAMFRIKLSCYLLPGGIWELSPWPGRSMQSNLNVVISVFSAPNILLHLCPLNFYHTTCVLGGSGELGAQKFQHCPATRVKLGRNIVQVCEIGLLNPVNVIITILSI